VLLPLCLAVFAGLICVVLMTIQVRTMSTGEVGLSLVYFIYCQCLLLIARPRIGAFAVMSNRVHVVLHVDVEKAQGWSYKQVLVTVMAYLVQRYVAHSKVHAR
jgi:hypothetical protein